MPRNTVSTTNLIIYTGTDFTQFFTLETELDKSPINLTDYDIVAKMKKLGGSLNSISLNPTKENAQQGIMKLSLSSEQTANLPAGRYFYDVILIKNSVNDRVIEGDVIVKKSVTR